MSRTVDGLTDRTVVVAGAGRAGLSAAAFLAAVGARVLVADNRFETSDDSSAADQVRAVGARPVPMSDVIVRGTGLDGVDLVIASPGFAPTHPLMVGAAESEVPVWGEVELAWFVDHSGALGPARTWLVITGTNGKTTTTSMIADIVDAAGRVGAACGNIGLPVLDALQQTPRVEVLCVEMSSFQLHWAPSVTPDVGVVLNVADDHLDWHGSFDAYAHAKAGALRGRIGVVGLDDRVAASIPVNETTTRRVGFTLAEPEAGELGVIDGELVDRAFTDQQAPTPLASAGDIHPPGPSGVSDALAAAALALGIGIPVPAISAALASFRPAAHRGEVVATLAGIDFIDDSKATNPHAAQAAITAHDRVVLIAGGLLKGASIDGLVRDTRARLAGVVAIGRDRDLVIEAVARHAPEVPTVTVFTGDDGGVIVQHRAGRPSPGVSMSLVPRSAEPSVAVMDRAVAEAWSLAVSGGPGSGDSSRVDAVLLAPAAASLDMFASYGKRGEAFAEAADRIVAGYASEGTDADDLR